MSSSIAIPLVMGFEIANELVLALGIESSGTASPAMSVDTTLIASALLVSLHRLFPFKGLVADPITR